MSIPKKIHYCWFGGNRLPKSAKRCIASWKKYCPDYEIIRWDESNFDVSGNLYAKQAMELKKYAFVSDYVRLKILYDHGGIYMDTDVEVVKPLDDLLENKGYMGFEMGLFLNESKRVCEMASGLGMGAEKGNPIIGAMLKDYDDIPFVDKDGNMDMMTCPQRNTRALVEYGFKTNGELQSIDGFKILPCEYLAPMDYISRRINVTDKTYSIHRYDGSYLTKEDRRRMIENRIYSSDLYGFLRKIKRRILGKQG